MKFEITYSRTYKREVDSESLAEAAARAKKLCDNTPDLKLLSVVDPNFKPMEAA